MTLKRLLTTFLIIIIALTGCKKTKYNFNDLPPTVKSYFTVANNQWNINETIQFTNQSENGDSYFWDFGDGTTSTEKDPSKTYPNPGTYTVKLRVIGQGGTGNYSMDIVIIDPNIIIDTDKELYFIEYGSKLVRKISLVPGSTVETVINMTGREAHGMAYDSINKHIYYCDFQNTNSGKIWRMDFDGENLVELLSGLASPYGVALNLAEGKMYIADGPNVSRANLDGSEYEKTFITIPGGAMRSVAFNSKSNTMYFYEVNDENLFAAKTDGTGVEAVIEGAYGYGIFIDEVNDKIYYDDRNNTGIMQANLDGSGITKIANVTGNRGGSGIVVDYKENKLYWAETNNGFIKRANLDGSGAETFLSGVNNPRGMFIK